ncbi:MAG: hypothetical protein ACK56I_35580, partial [bacterium]
MGSHERQVGTNEASRNEERRRRPGGGPLQTLDKLVRQTAVGIGRVLDFGGFGRCPFRTVVSGLGRQ